MAFTNVTALVLGAALIVTTGLSVASARRRLAELRSAESRTAAHLASARRLQDINNGASDAILVTDRDGVVVYASARAEQLLGVTVESLMLRQVTEVVQLGRHESVRAALDRAAKADPDVRLSVEYQIPQSNGSTRTLEAHLSRLSDSASVPGVVWTIGDVSDRRARDHFSGQALHDRLSGLPNRGLLVESLETALGRARRMQTRLAVVALDIDDFKDTSAALWHHVAEEIIVTAASRVRGAGRPGDLAARTGVDEFTLVYDGFADVDDIVDLVELALSKLKEPMAVGDRTVQLSVSAGIALTHPDQETSNALDVLQEASLALAQAKKSDRGSFRLFDESMRRRAERPFDMAADLRAATSDHDAMTEQIQLLYQPLVHLETMALEGFEALVRWEHPVRGTISAIDLVRMAEETGDIIEVGRHVLFTACAQAATWGRQDPTRMLRISVNVSPGQLADDIFIDHVREALASSGLPPQQLILEITESDVLNDLASVRDRLQALRSLGIRVAMDDFGTGYSSLANLHRLPLDILKIDKAFVDDDAYAGTHLLEAVIDLGTSLGLDTVAEGIEVPDQLETARAAGCTFGQGYLIAKPLSVDAASVFIADHETLAQAGARTVSADRMNPLN